VDEDRPFFFQVFSSRCCLRLALHRKVPPFGAWRGAVPPAPPPLFRLDAAKLARNRAPMGAHFKLTHCLQGSLKEHGEGLQRATEDAQRERSAARQGAELGPFPFAAVVHDVLLFDLHCLERIRA
jgi:hypothetical protein